MNKYLSAGIGLGAGIATPFILKEVVEKNFQKTIPYIDQIIPSPYSDFSTFIPGVTGVLSLVTGYIKRDKNYSTALLAYGITSLIFTVLNLIPAPPTSRGQLAPIRPKPHVVASNSDGKTITGRRNENGGSVRGGPRVSCNFGVNETALVREPDQIRPDSTLIPYDVEHKFNGKIIVA